MVHDENTIYRTLASGQGLARMHILSQSPSSKSQSYEHEEKELLLTEPACFSDSFTLCRIGSKREQMWVIRVQCPTFFWLN